MLEGKGKFFFLVFFFQFLKFNNFIYFQLHWVFIAFLHWLSLVAVIRGLFFIGVLGLLIVVASLVAKHGL